MITASNLGYGLNNVIDSLEEILALLIVQLQTGTAGDFPIMEVGAQISIASMQLSALAEDCTGMVVDEKAIDTVHRPLPTGASIMENKDRYVMTKKGILKRAKTNKHR